MSDWLIKNEIGMHGLNVLGEGNKIEFRELGQLMKHDHGPIGHFHAKLMVFTEWKWRMAELRDSAPETYMPRLAEKVQQQTFAFLAEAESDVLLPDVAALIRDICAATDEDMVRDAVEQFLRTCKCHPCENGYIARFNLLQLQLAQERYGNEWRIFYRPIGYYYEQQNEKARIIQFPELASRPTKKTVVSDAGKKSQLDGVEYHEAPYEPSAEDLGIPV